ncbi:2'-5'-Oligoadenylate Synthase 3 [Manis pentadactyla]|nr:2'-5'-Oligoadenylate Synthase 3 [Manis pentadactyla]
MRACLGNSRCWGLLRKQFWIIGFLKWKKLALTVLSLQRFLSVQSRTRAPLPATHCSFFRVDEAACRSRLDLIYGLPGRRL